MAYFEFIPIKKTRKYVVTLESLVITKAVKEKDGTKCRFAHKPPKMTGSTLETLHRRDRRGDERRVNNTGERRTRQRALGGKCKGT